MDDDGLKHYLRRVHPIKASTGVSTSNYITYTGYCWLIERVTWVPNKATPGTDYMEVSSGNGWQKSFEVVPTGDAVSGYLHNGYYTKDYGDLLFGINNPSRIYLYGAAGGTAYFYYREIPIAILPYLEYNIPTGAPRGV